MNRKLQRLSTPLWVSYSGAYTFQLCSGMSNRAVTQVKRTLIDQNYVDLR